jgi:type IV pilus assembly protein PilO
MFKIEVLQERPWYLQFAAFGVVALLLYGVFWYFVTGDTRAATQDIQAQVAQLQSANAGAVVASQRLSEFKSNYARAQADYEDLKALLPEQRELTMILQNVQDRARDHQLTLTRFTPKDEVQQDFYTGKPVEVVLTGTYNNVGQFFAQMAAYQRIVSITDFKFTKLNDAAAQDKKDAKTVNAQFLLTAYYVSPEKLQAAPTPAPAGQQPAPAQTGQQPAPAAPQPTPAPAGQPAAANPTNPMQAAHQAANAASNAPTATGK